MSGPKLNVLRSTERYEESNMNSTVEIDFSLNLTNHKRLNWSRDRCDWSNSSIESIFTLKLLYRIGSSAALF